MEIPNLPTIPESIITSSENLLSKLFGPTLSEIGQNYADKIRYRRFRNQVEIFAKASDFLKAKGINAKPIALKHLTPLIELSSLEEDPKIQEKWANIIANLSTYNSMEIFNRNCINLLNILSPEEIYILDYLNDEFIKQKGEVFLERNNVLMLNDYRDILSEDISFNPWDLGKKFNFDDFKVKLFIENLVSLGLLQHEEIELEDDELIKSYDVHLSYLAIYFVRLCKYS
jgi:hypothetical protein